MSTEPAKLLDNPLLKELTEQIVDRVFYEPFSSEGREQDETLSNGVFEAFVAGGLEGVKKFCVDYAMGDGSAWGPRDQLSEDIRRLVSLEDEAIEVILARDRNLRAMGPEGFEEAFIEALVERVEAAADQDPLGIIPGPMDVLVAYAPGLPADLSIEDRLVNSISPYLPNDLGYMPGPALASFFEFANLSKSEWLEHVRDIHGINLLDPASGAEKYPDHAGEFEKLAKGWASLDWETKVYAPRLISVDEASTIIENASDSSTPTLFVKFPLFRFITEVDLNRPLELLPGIKQCVGELGLHDFINGSGYVDSFVKVPISIEPGKGQWLASEKPRGFLTGMRKVYDPTERHLSPVFKTNLKPELALRDPAAEGQLGLDL